MTQAKQQKAAGTAYLDHIKGQKGKKDVVQLVDVTAPSGFVFKFEKPSAYHTLFNSGRLPLSATNRAVEKWLKDGVGAKPGEGNGDADLIQLAFTVRDKVLRFSHTPKLVVGEAKNNNELSTDDVADEDLDYLFKWVAAGGEAGAMLGTFPNGSQPSPLASASREKQRVPVQQISGDR